jgi:hypothetical protein
VLVDAWLIQYCMVAVETMHATGAVTDVSRAAGCRAGASHEETFTYQFLLRYRTRWQVVAQHAARPGRSTDLQLP